ncbi:unnamed protein product [Paramecium pentaurelia]|uniref:Transmembrane protein n=1 Tax=Paramecium pentaurelia TaxID=43138 RepID=A0A8S1U2A0_9CILI|nr:unnamed protein product [Paramecium pentaurelia]
MIILLLLNSVIASKPEVKLNVQNNKQIQFTAIVDQTKILYEDPSCFQIVLWKRSAKDSHKYKFTDQDYDLLVQEEHKLQGISECVPIQKQFLIQQHLRMGLPSNEKIFYTDLIILQNRALIIRNDFTLQEVNIAHSQFTKTVTQQKLKIPHSDISHPIFLWNNHNKRVYIISENGGVSIPDWISIGENTFFINSEPFKQRKIVYDAYLKDNTIYVACGYEGVDVYNYQDGQLKYFKNIARIDEKYLNAKDISGDDENIYILDHYQGLLICDYDFQIKFRVPILMGSDFSHYKNTFFVIAESQRRQDYALEIFLNFTDNSYYFNHYYIDEMQFYDVKVYENYTILIGYEAHKIIQHSIFSQFIKFSSNNFFEFPQMLQLKQWNDSIVGLSKRELRLLQINQLSAHIECESQEYFSESFLVASYFLNSSSPFIATKFNQVFQIIFQDTKVLSKKNLTLFGIALFLIFLIFWLVLLSIACFKRLRNRIIKLEDDKRALTKQVDMDKDDGPGQELSAI